MKKNNSTQKPISNTIVISFRVSTDLLKNDIKKKIRKLINSESFNSK